MNKSIKVEITTTIRATFHRPFQCLEELNRPKRGFRGQSLLACSTWTMRCEIYFVS